MSGPIAGAALNPTGPLTGEIGVITVTAASSHTNLTTLAAVAAAIARNEIIVVQADDFDVWFRWSTATSGETADETAASGNDCVALLYVGERLPERPPAGTQGFVAKGRGTTRVRFYRGARPDY